MDDRFELLLLHNVVNCKFASAQKVLNGKQKFLENKNLKRNSEISSNGTQNT